METTLTEARIRAMTGAGHWRDESLEGYLDRWARERPSRVTPRPRAPRLPQRRSQPPRAPLQQPRPRNP